MLPRVKHGQRHWVLRLWLGESHVHRGANHHLHPDMRRLALCGGVQWDATLTILDIRPLLRGRRVLDGQPQTAVCAKAVGAQRTRFEAYNLALPKRAVIGNVDEDLWPLAVGKEGPVMLPRR